MFGLFKKCTKVIYLYLYYIYMLYVLVKMIRTGLTQANQAGSTAEGKNRLDLAHYHQILMIWDTIIVFSHIKDHFI